MAEQEYHPVTEEEENKQTRTLREESWLRRMVWACASAAGLFAALLAWQHWQGGGDEAKKQRQEIAVLTEAEKILQRERTEIESVVRRVLGARTLDDLLPIVAGGEQVKELMAWYLNRSHPLTPETLSAVEKVEPLDADGREIRRVEVSTVQRPVVWMVMTREAGSWKLCWELYSNAHVERWHSFLREAPGAVVELPLLVVKKPAPDALILKAGATRDTHDAVMLCAGHHDDLAGAVLPRNSALWKELPGIGFEDAVKVISRVTLVDPQADPPLVRLEAVEQRGWVRGTQKPVAGNAPPQ